MVVGSGFLRQRAGAGVEGESERRMLIKTEKGQTRGKRLKRQCLYCLLPGSTGRIFCALGLGDEQSFDEDDRGSRHGEWAREGNLRIVVQRWRRRGGA